LKSPQSNPPPIKWPSERRPIVVSLPLTRIVIELILRNENETAMKSGPRKFHRPRINSIGRQLEEPQKRTNVEPLPPKKEKKKETKIFRSSRRLAKVAHKFSVASGIGKSLKNLSECGDLLKHGQRCSRSA